MIYTGQSFPNVSVQDGLVTLEANEKPIFDNDYIITYDQAMDLRIGFEASNKHVALLDRFEIQLPRQHYSWNSFVQTVKYMCYDVFKLKEVNVTKQEFYFAIGDSPQNRMTFKVTMSPDLVRIFDINLTPVQLFDRSDNTSYFRIPIGKIPTVQNDTSKLFYTPHAAETSCHIYVADELIFKLTPQYWTVNMFKRAINALGKVLPKTSNLTGLNVLDSDVPEKCTLRFTPNKPKKDKVLYLPVYFSPGFQTIFKTSTLQLQLNYNEALAVPLTITVAEDHPNIRWRSAQSKGHLPYDFYPTSTSLINQLNEVIMKLKVDLDTQRKASNSDFTFFSLNDGVVTYSTKAGYKVLLSPALLKMMHLQNDWLVNNVTATKTFIIQSYKRNHLYVHLDCLDHHYINNNVSDLIRVVPNNAPLDEETQVAFQDPRYYSVSQRYLSVINMYITDSPFEGILHFKRPVTYTLHFRKAQA
jgi:hypothetical protein